MIGIAGALSRMAFETAIAARSCGPPMIVTPTAPTRVSLMVRSTVAMKSRSMLPSMMVDEYLPSSAMDRLRTAKGNRALRRAVIVGLMRSMRDALFGSVAVANSIIAYFRIVGGA